MNEPLAIEGASRPEAKLRGAARDGPAVELRQHAIAEASVGGGAVAELAAELDLLLMVQHVALQARAKWAESRQLEAQHLKLEGCESTGGSCAALYAELAVCKIAPWFAPE